MLLEPLVLSAAGLLTPLNARGRSTHAAMRNGLALCDAGVVEEDMLRAIAADCGGAQRAAMTDMSIDKALRLALAVAQQALHQAAWGMGVIADERTGLFCGTSKGPVLTALQGAALAQGVEFPIIPERIARQIAAGPDAMGQFLVEQLRFCGPRQTYVAACASGLFALHAAAQALRSGQLDRALVVAADASVHPLLLASFHRMGVLATPDAEGHRRCRPFDEAGEGFFLSEAAAAVTLERASAGGTRDMRAPTVLERTWIGADGTHLLATDVAAKSLRRGLRQCAADGPIDFIHAHATGTAADQYELAALRSIAPEPVHIFSHKGWLGHSLGAAGLVSLVLSAECHHAGVTLDGVTVPPHARSLTVAQGFGGHIAIAALRSA